MKLSSWKLEECQQNGMSSRDYAEWIKYLVHLATPPHTDATEQRRHELIELRKFILTLDDGEERVHLSNLKLERIQDAVAALEGF